MAFEIELKARVDEREKLKSRLDSLGEYECAYEKNDAYWVTAPGAQNPPLPENRPLSGVRVRREQNTGPGGHSSGRVLVTCKAKEIHGGIEINDEREFEVSDGAAFEELLERLGLRAGSVKKKKGQAWNCAAPGEPDVRAELSEVEGLGWFIELEIIANDNSKKTVTAGRNRLLSLLDTLGVPRDSIESRAYTSMLREDKATDSLTSLNGRF
jgi:adenylate cyclase class 2